jgi:hypothetical protein
MDALTSLMPSPRRLENVFEKVRMWYANWSAVLVSKALVLNARPFVSRGLKTYGAAEGGGSYYW